jgi:hypothetical protein
MKLLMWTKFLLIRDIYEMRYYVIVTDTADNCTIDLILIYLFEEVYFLFIQTYAAIKNQNKNLLNAKNMAAPEISC